MIRNFILGFCLLILSTEAFAIHPSKDYVALPSGYGMSYDSLNISTTDHFRLTGWYCKPAVDTSHLLIVLAGGDAGNMSYDLPLVQFIIQNFHVPVLLFDYRGFGTSDTFAYNPEIIGQPEYLTDLDAAVSNAKSSYPSKKIIIYGRSLGASLALVEGSIANGIAGVIAESPYIVQDSLKKHIEAENPIAHIVPIVSDKLEPMQHVKDFRSKHLLMMHGAIEKYMLWNELKAYFDAVPITNKVLLDFPGCDHLEAPIKATQQFGNAMEEFLASCE